LQEYLLETKIPMICWLILQEQYIWRQTLKALSTFKRLINVMLLPWETPHKKNWKSGQYCWNGKSGRWRLKVRVQDATVINNGEKFNIFSFGQILWKGWTMKQTKDFTETRNCQSTIKFGWASGKVMIIIRCRKNKKLKQRMKSLDWKLNLNILVNILCNVIVWPNLQTPE
jgi:hypothetical protein